MWEAGKRLFYTATGEYMREATITIFILFFHLILPGASDGGKDIAYADAFILPFYPSFTFENVTAQCYNKSQDRHQKACFFLLLFPYLSMASVFFVRLNKWRVFPDLLLYFCVLRSARIGYNTA